MVVRKGDENALKEAVIKYGPVTVAITCVGKNFMFYKGGVFYDRSPRQVNKMNHAMTVVGFGSTRDNYGRKVDYWIVKNSFGTSWGEKGYIRMIRNMNNNCDIASDATYPII
jgi:cathepsin L